MKKVYINGKLVGNGSLYWVFGSVSSPGFANFISSYSVFTEAQMTAEICDQEEVSIYSLVQNDNAMHFKIIAAFSRQDGWTLYNVVQGDT